MKLWTIGFTKKSAEDFFGLLRMSGAKHLVDVRLNNVSQLAGFAKKQDLAYFLREICGMEYEHVPILAPTQEMLDGYRKEKRGWDDYERRFLQLMEEREIQDEVPRDVIDGSCLLCSEETPHRCHRRLVAEYLQREWGDLDVEHLV